MLSGDGKIKGVGGPLRPVSDADLRKKEKVAEKPKPETGDVAAAQRASRTLAGQGPDANSALKAASRQFGSLPGGRVTEADIVEARDRLVKLRASGAEDTERAGKFCADLTNYSLMKHGRIS